MTLLPSVALDVVKIFESSEIEKIYFCTPHMHVFKQDVLLIFSRIVVFSGRVDLRFVRMQEQDK